MSTLEQVSLELQELNTQTDLSTELMEDVKGLLTKMNDTLYSIFDAQRDAALFEKRKLDKSNDISSSAIAPTAVAMGSNSVEEEGNLLLDNWQKLALAGLATALAAIPAAIIGAIKEYVKAVKKLFSGILKKGIAPIRAALKSLDLRFAGFVGRITTALRSIRESLSIKNIAKKTLPARLAASELRVAFSTLTARVVSGLKFITAPIHNVAKSFRATIAEAKEPLKRIQMRMPKAGLLKSLLDTITDTIRLFFNLVKFFGQFFATIFRVISGFGRLLGRLLLPLQIIFAIFESVKGMIEGWKKSRELDMGVLGTLMSVVGNAIVSLIKGFILWPLDLIKDLISWTMGLFGFDKAVEWLDKFSFVEDIGGFLEGVVDGVSSFFSNIVDGLWVKWYKITGQSGKAAEAQGRIDKRKSGGTNADSSVSEAEMQTDAANLEEAEVRKQIEDTFNGDLAVTEVNAERMKHTPMGQMYLQKSDKAIETAKTQLENSIVSDKLDSPHSEVYTIDEKGRLTIFVNGSSENLSSPYDGDVRLENMLQATSENNDAQFAGRGGGGSAIVNAPSTSISTNSNVTNVQGSGIAITNSLDGKATGFRGRGG